MIPCSHMSKIPNINVVRITERKERDWDKTIIWRNNEWKFFLMLILICYFLLGHLFICALGSLSSWYFNIFFSICKSSIFYYYQFRVSLRNQFWIINKPLYFLIKYVKILNFSYGKLKLISMWFVKTSLNVPVS